MDQRTIYLLDVLKNDFGSTDEALFQGVTGHVNSFSASLASKKSDLDEVT
jgi:hypothetical protein